MNFRMCYHVRMSTLIRIAAALIFLAGAGAVSAAPSVEFMISGMDPANVMRFVDPDDASNLRIGYVQSTQFSHGPRGRRKTGATEDGILYYAVRLKKIAGEEFELTLSYDFAVSDGRSRGIRTRSIVTEQILKAITADELKERARAHADDFSKVVFENFLKTRIGAGELPNLRDFLAGLSADLLKTMPKDAIMIIRRWDDLSGRRSDGS